MHVITEILAYIPSDDRTLRREDARYYITSRQEMSAVLNLFREIDFTVTSVIVEV